MAVAMVVTREAREPLVGRTIRIAGIRYKIDRPLAPNYTVAPNVTFS